MPDLGDILAFSKTTRRTIVFSEGWDLRVAQAAKTACDRNTGQGLICSAHTLGLGSQLGNVNYQEQHK